MSIRLPEGRYVSPAEFARTAGITVKTVYRAVREGRLKAYRIDGRILLAADQTLTDKRIKTGKYIGVSSFRKDLDAEKLAKARGIVI